MKRIALITAVALVACVGLTEPQAKSISANTGTNDTVTATDATIAGYIDEIVMVLPTGTAVTGTVAVAVTPPQGSAITLASKTIAATTLVRPRLDATDAAGSAVTGDETWRYLSYGDTFTMTVSAANTTGLTWLVWIKYDDGK